MGNKNKLQWNTIFGGSVKKKILIRGPALSQSGYGEQARFALESIESLAKIYLIYLLWLFHGEKPAGFGKIQSLALGWMRRITLTQVLIQTQTTSSRYVFANNNSQ